MKIELDDERLSPGTLTAAEPEPATDGRLYCGRCEVEITTEDARVVRGGAHQHVFMNPEAYVYKVGCFAKAPGCVVTGRPTSYFSWFQGYAWSYALCKFCDQHLGWRYDGAAGSFFGLIVERLVSG